MKGARRSTVDESSLWGIEQEEEDDEGWRCWKHTWQPRYGVCPACLRDRLLRLCPECANVRPCACLPSSSSSSSSFSSLSSSDIVRSGPASAGIGVVGKVSCLIDSEPAFRRSRSVGFQLVRSRSITSAAATATGSGEPCGAKRRRWAALWPFSRANREANKVPELSRSRSVGVGSGSNKGIVEEKGKGWIRYFPSPMKAFRLRKSATTRVGQDRSPLKL